MRQFRLTVSTALLVLFAPAARAQTYEVFHAFGLAQGDPTGTLVRTPDGTLYGTTQTGGRYGLGSVFSLTLSSGGYTFTELHAFSGPDGAAPAAGLAASSDGTFWGTSIYGGQNARGEVFQIGRSGAVTVMHSFNVSDGESPVAALTPTSDGGFMGTTEEGGASGFGVVYRIDATGQYFQLHDFDGADGKRPRGRLLAGTDGFFYGTTVGGGANDYGSVFRVDTAGNLTTLHSFDLSTGDPEAGLTEGADGYFYGTTANGDGGTAFRMDSMGNVATLHQFDYLEGAPMAELVAVAPNVFRGTTSSGGSDGYGTIFQIDSSGEFVILQSFHGTDGAAPMSAITLGSAGSLYGVTTAGGAGNLGTVFKVDAGNTLTTLYEFTRSDGTEPVARLIQGSDGDLYGTTPQGGLDNNGTIYRLDSGGNQTILYSFSPSEGPPSAGLVQASDSEFYGTTVGGFLGQGTIYRFDLGTQAIETLHSFTQAVDGYIPESDLLQAPDGKLYGTAIRGGPLDRGTLYRIDTNGEFELLYSFSGPDGSYPTPALVLAADGALYGTTTAGGSSPGSSGTAFRLDLSGGFSSIHSFVNPEGTAPEAPLIQATDENLYGTSTTGGANGNGTVYRMSLAGSPTVIHSFGGTDGATPVAALALGSDGALYGTTTSGGPTYGTLFRSTLDGNLSTLYSFQFDGDGDSSQDALLQASDGNFYGVSATSGYDSLGYTLSLGLVFRWVTSPATPSISSIFPTSGRAGGGTSLSIVGEHFQPGATASVGGVGVDDGNAFDHRTVLGIAPSLAPGTLNDVTVTNPDATNAALVGAWFADFLDVPNSYLFHDAVETVFRNGITAGCGSGNYCPSSSVTRAQMAVFLLKGEHGGAYLPPSCSATVFTDVPCPGGTNVDWINQLSAEGITGGCGGGNYCPGSAVSRAQMAVFLLKAEHGSSYVPPGCVGIFLDVECTPIPAFAVNWIEELYNEGITGGCGGGNYCPGNSVTRGQMAVFLVRTFSLQ